MKARHIVLITLGTIAAGVATAVGTKKFMDKKHATDSEDDRGVSPVRIYEDENEEDSTENDDDIPNLKADAINDGYKPSEY